MATINLLVIAPDFDLRRSLEFALEAEGYSVTARPDIEAAGLLPSARFDCTVLDSAALTDAADEAISFCAKCGPVVLLSDHPVPWLSSSIAAVVETPTLGEALSTAIRRAVGQNADAEGH